MISLKLTVKIAAKYCHIVSWQFIFIWMIRDGVLIAFVFGIAIMLLFYEIKPGIKVNNGIGGGEMSVFCYSVH